MKNKIFYALFFILLCGFLSFLYDEYKADPKLFFKTNSKFNVKLKFEIPHPLEDLESKCLNHPNQYALYACQGIGHFYTYQKDFEKAYKFYEFAATNNPTIKSTIYTAKTAMKLENNKNAIEILEKNCNENYEENCFELGEIYLNKNADYKKASYYFKKACDNYNYASCAKLALTQEKLGDFSNALINYEKACKFANVSCEELSILQTKNLNSTSKPAQNELENFLQQNNKLCDEKNGEACFKLANYFKKYDEKKSSSYSKKACEFGYKNSCEHKKANNSKLKNLKQNCDNNDFKSCTSYGYELDMLKDTKYNDEIEKAYKKACNGGRKIACSNLGLFYDRKKEIDKAFLYFKKACDWGHAKACFNAGMNRAFDIEPADDKMAIIFFKKACDLGHARACYKGASTLEHSFNNEIEAKDMYKKSCLYGGIGCGDAD